MASPSAPTLRIISTRSETILQQAHLNGATPTDFGALAIGTVAASGRRKRQRCRRECAMSPASLLLTLAILFGLLGLGSHLIRSRVRNADLSRIAFVAMALLLAGFALHAAVADSHQSPAAPPTAVPVACGGAEAVPPSAGVCAPNAAPVASHPADHRQRHGRGSAPRAQTVSQEASGAGR